MLELVCLRHAAHSLCALGGTHERSAQIEIYLSNRMLWVKLREILKCGPRKLLREGILLAEVIVTFVTRKVRIVTNVTVIRFHLYVQYNQFD